MYIYRTLHLIIRSYTFLRSYTNTEHLLNFITYQVTKQAAANGRQYTTQCSVIKNQKIKPCHV